MKKPSKKRNPRSEASQREAVKNCRNLIWDIFIGPLTVTLEAYQKREVVAVFDLRDIYRKRKPLTGITKKLRSAIQPRRKRK